LALLALATSLMVAILTIAGPGVATDLPDWQRYPLPDRLAVVGDPSGDYCDRLDRTPVGSLIWTKFPVAIFLDRANSKAPRETAWLNAVRQAIGDWDRYLPLIETNDPEKADITIRRGSVPIQREKDGRIKPIRFAETRFVFYLHNDRLWHRMTITLSPNQADASMLAGARHELGHALGIWGHSDRESDIMYFSQVKQPPEISRRDVNTLKRVYGEPTRLGGPVSAPVNHQGP
jgi:predicted Zn-dependent protease